MKVPKRLDVNLMRARLGDAEVERIIMKTYADKLVPQIKIKQEEYESTLALLSNPTNPSKGMRVPLVFRQWFAERPRNAGVFKVWLNEKIAATAPIPEPKAVKAAKKRRRAA